MHLFDRQERQLGSEGLHRYSRGKFTDDGLGVTVAAALKSKCARCAGAQDDDLPPVGSKFLGLIA